MGDTPQHVSVTMSDGTAWVKVQRPDVLNAISSKLLNELIPAVQETARADDCRAILLTGSGRAFMAGADVRAMVDMTPSQFRDYIERIQELTEVIRRAAVPVIAVINGVAVGAGCEIAAACDYRLASDEATFSFPEAQLGIVVTSGASYYLPRVVGPGWAKRLLFTGEQIDALRAHELGFVDQIAEPEMVSDEATKLAEAIQDSDPFAVALSKKLLNLSEGSSLEVALGHEVESILSCFVEGRGSSKLREFVDRRAAKKQAEES